MHPYIYKYLFDKIKRGRYLLVHLLCLALLVMTGQAMQAKESGEEGSGTITGRVIDAGNSEPLEFATISVYTGDSSLVTGNITGNDGSFEINVPEGSYDVTVRFIAYRPMTVENVRVTSGQPRVNIGEIHIQPDSKTINEVTVTGEKSRMVIKLDKKVFNVGKDLANAGKSAADILDNIPSVTVDLDGNVSLRGSQGVRLLVDGKPSGMIGADNPSALKNLQGSIIDHVEVVTNPSARYEAEGMSGIINIVLKKDQKQGVNGSFEASAGYPHDYRLGANVNFRHEKLNYFVNYGVDYDERPGDGTAYQKFMLDDTTYYTDMTRRRVRTGWDQNLRAGADYFFSEKSKLTAAAFVGYSDEANTTTLHYRDMDADRNLVALTSRTDHEKEPDRNLEFSLNYSKEFQREDRKLEVFAQYSDRDDLEKNDITEDAEYYGPGVTDADPVLQKVYNREDRRRMLLQADYVHPFRADGRFEAGYRSELRFIGNPYRVQEKNVSGGWDDLSAFTNDFDYTENVHAGYAQIGDKFGNWSLQFGLRTEFSDVRTHQSINDEQTSKKYFDFFPTVHTAYEFDGINSVQLSYSRRIERPNFWSLNPFYSYTDARNIRTGNTDLEPEYTDSYELGYLLSNGNANFYAGGYLRNTDGVTERIHEVGEKGITYSIPYNLARRQSYGVESNVSVDPIAWWTVSGDVNMFRAITTGEYKGEDLSSDDLSWNTRLNSMMRFRNDLDIQVTFFYRAPQRSIQGIRKSYSMTNVGIGKDVLRGNGTLTLNVRDLFNTRKHRYIIDQENLYSENEFRWSSRRISLSFSYRLNQAKKAPSRDDNGGGFGSDT